MTKRSENVIGPYLYAYYSTVLNNRKTVTKDFFISVQVNYYKIVTKLTFYTSIFTLVMCIKIIVTSSLYKILDTDKSDVFYKKKNSIVQNLFLTRLIN